MRLVVAALIALTLVAPAAAQSPSPRPRPHKTPVMSLAHPSPAAGVNGTFCNRNAAALQQRINLITGQPQAETVVSIPVTKNSGGVQSNTSRQQQLDTCAHTR